MKKYRVPVAIGGAIRVAEEDAETDILTVLIPENKEAYASKYIGNVVVEAESAVVARDEVLHRATGAFYGSVNKWIYIAAKTSKFNVMDYAMDEPNKLSCNRHKMLVGQMSNLLTDMMMDGTATDEEFIDAFCHSLVILDAHKHNLDYKRSAEDHRIKELLAKYRKHRKVKK